MFPLEKLEAVQANPENYRLLTKLPELTKPVVVRPSTPDSERLVLIVDVETTGLDHQADEVIEIGLTLVSYLPAFGHITRILKSASFYNDPGRPIPDFITQLTGITDEMVRGHRIDYEEHLAEFFDDAFFVVAHNAGFDRPFVERLLPAEKHALKWGCTCDEIDWKAMGHEGLKLKYLGIDHGFFFEGHRASNDCEAVAWMLAKNYRAFQELLDSVKATTVRIDAVGSPFETKDDLKARGYRWDGERRVWHRTVPERDLDGELEFLDSLRGYQSKRARLTRQTARERFKAVV